MAMSGRVSPFIDPREYSELNAIVWDIDDSSISRREAFHLYVNRWGHVDTMKLTEKERALIESLTIEYGRGYFFPKAHGRANIDEKFLSVAIPESSVDEEHCKKFREFISDESYPGRRNGTLYFWKSDYEAFLKKVHNLI